MTISEDMQEAIRSLPERVREPAYDGGGHARRAALTGLLDLARTNPSDPWNPRARHDSREPGTVTG
jgi:hypothetical protein